MTFLRQVVLVLSVLLSFAANAADIAFVSAATNKTNGQSASLVITKPAGTVENHVMIAVIALDNASETVTATGWTQIHGPTASTLDGGQIRSYRRVAGSSEGANYTFTPGSSQHMAGAILTYENVSTSSPVETSSENPDSTGGASPRTVTATTITPSGNKRMLIWVGSVDNNSAGATASTPPGGYTERADVVDDQGWANVSLAELLQTTAAATGSVSGTITHSGSSGFMAHLIALNPADGGGGGGGTVVNPISGRGGAAALPIVH